MRGLRSRIVCRRGLLLPLAALLLSGCAKIVPPAVPAGDDPLDQVHIATFGSIARTGRQVVPLSRAAYHARWWFQDRLAGPRSFPAEPKIDPELERLVHALPATSPVEVLVAFRDTIEVRVFPRLDEGAALLDSTNAARLDSAGAMVQTLRIQRRSTYERDTLSLKTNLGASGFTTFWLVQASKMTIPAGNVLALAALPNVEYVGPEIGPFAPDHDGVPTNDVAVGRDDLGSDPWFQLLMPPGRIALIDTGVRTTHRLLCSPSPLCLIVDLVNQPWAPLPPSTACSVQGPQCQAQGGGDTYSEGHGTATAAILSGNGQAVPLGSTNGDRFRGVTRARLDCFQVYGSDRKVRMSAVARAIEIAMERLDPIIVVEVQANQEPGTATVSHSADRAHRAGFAILAANGNERADGVGVPAATRRSLGIGAYHVPLQTPPIDMARGPTPDGRVKPDLLAQSYLETAATSPGASGSDASRDLDMEPFGGTSGATPFAGGAACLIRNWMSAPPASSPDPGQVYAMLLVAGTLDGAFAPGATEGVGLIHLPLSGQARSTKLGVTTAVNTADFDLPIAASQGFRKISAAIWWPENARRQGTVPIDTHNDLDLEIVAPGFLGFPGTVEARSAGPNGVFERTHVERASGLSGTWTVRVRAKTMRTPSQVVYVAVALTP